MKLSIEEKLQGIIDADKKIIDIIIEMTEIMSERNDELEKRIRYLETEVIKLSSCMF